MTDHTRTKKIDGDSIFMFVVIQVVVGNRYDKDVGGVCMLMVLVYEALVNQVD